MASSSHGTDGCGDECEDEDSRHDVGRLEETPASFDQDGLSRVGNEVTTAVYEESEDTENKDDDTQNNCEAEPEQRTEMTVEEMKAMYDAVKAGDINLLDDLLDLPCADINMEWYSENLLMAALRSGQTAMAAFLIDNGVDYNYQTTHMDKDETTGTIEWYTFDCRQLAYEMENYDIVELIDEKNGVVWPHKPNKPRNIRYKKTPEEKLREPEEQEIARDLSQKEMTLVATEDDEDEASSISTGDSMEEASDGRRDGSTDLTSAFSREQTIDISREDTIDISREDRIDISREDTIDISREDRIDISREDRIDISREDTIDISREDRIDISREDTIDISREHTSDFNTEQTSDDITKEQTSDISREDAADISTNPVSDITRENMNSSSTEHRFDKPAKRPIVSRSEASAGDKEEDTTGSRKEVNENTSRQSKDSARVTRLRPAEKNLGQPRPKNSGSSLEADNTPRSSGEEHSSGYSTLSSSESHPTLADIKRVSGPKSDGTHFRKTKAYLSRKGVSTRYLTEPKKSDPPRVRTVTAVGSFHMESKLWSFDPGYRKQADVFINRCTPELVTFRPWSHSKRNDISRIYAFNEMEYPNSICYKKSRQHGRRVAESKMKTYNGHTMTAISPERYHMKRSNTDIFPYASDRNIFQTRRTSPISLDLPVTRVPAKPAVHRTAPLSASHEQAKTSTAVDLTSVLRHRGKAFDLVKKYSPAGHLRYVTAKHSAMRS